MLGQYLLQISTVEQQREQRKMQFHGKIPPSRGGRIDMNQLPADIKNKTGWRPYEPEDPAE